MAAATVTSKGQLTLPKEIRTALGVGPGDRVAFRIHEDGVITVEPEKLDLQSLRGAIQTKIKGVTIEAMNDAVRRSASRR
jgi:AbrB family looped-hinge helix DNA binding protein